jgi:hypothetical protein
MNCCVDLCYEMVWSCFEKHVLTRFSRAGRKLTWIKYKETKAAKRSRASKKRSIEEETIDDCECEHLQGEFLPPREEYQLMHGRVYDNYRVGIQASIKSNLNTFYGYLDLNFEEEACWLPVGYAFRRSFGIRPLLILNNEHMLMMYGCLLILDQISCRRPAEFN